MRKPSGLSHYLVLRDLINGIDVREKNDNIFYMTSRIENIKGDLNRQGLNFIEDIRKDTSYSYYKPYLLNPTKNNIQKAESLLEIYATDEVIKFLENTKKSNNGK